MVFLLDMSCMFVEAREHSEQYKYAYMAFLHRKFY